MTDTELDKKRGLAKNVSSGSSTEDMTGSILNEIDNIPRARFERNVDETFEKLFSSIDPALVAKLREKVISKNFEDINRSTQVDLCFVLDCTGSMASYIAAAKDCILKVVDLMKDANIKLWVGFCGYRDHCDSENRLQIFDFTDSYSELKRYISDEVQATGGGDEPEDVLGGLDAAINGMSWSHRTRVLLHLGDSPPHGRRFNNVRDDYPKGDPNGLTAESVLEKVKLEEIVYNFGKITHRTDKMLSEFRTIIGNFLIFDLASEGRDPEALIAKLIEATCSSIIFSVERQRKNREMDPNEPDWNTLTKESGKLLYYRIPETLAEIKSSEYFEAKSNLSLKKISYKCASKPFAAGAEKYAYFGLDVTRDSDEKIIIKECIEVGEKANSIERYLEMVEVSAVAYFLSKEFNYAATKAGIQKKVNFLRSRALRHSSDSGTRHSSTRYYIIEPRLCDAEFKRFNSNNGVIKEYHSTLEGFAHFTYKYTEGYLVVYDLQGVELTDQFLLTDPAIHCKDTLRFGKTNFGEEGIERCFLMNHRCGSVCQKLGLDRIIEEEEE